MFDKYNKQDRVKLLRHKLNKTDWSKYDLDDLTSIVDHIEGLN